MLVGCNLIYITLRGGFWLSPMKSEGLSIVYDVSVIRIGMLILGVQLLLSSQPAIIFLPPMLGRTASPLRQLQSAVSVL